MRKTTFTRLLKLTAASGVLTAFVIGCGGAKDRRTPIRRTNGGSAAVTAQNAVKMDRADALIPISQIQGNAEIEKSLSNLHVKIDQLPKGLWELTGANVQAQLRPSAQNGKAATTTNGSSANGLASADKQLIVDLTNEDTPLRSEGDPAFQPTNAKSSIQGELSFPGIKIAAKFAISDDRQLELGVPVTYSYDFLTSALNLTPSASDDISQLMGNATAQSYGYLTQAGGVTSLLIIQVSGDVATISIQRDYSNDMLLTRTQLTYRRTEATEDTTDDQQNDEQPVADDTNADDAANQQILADLEAQYEQAKSEATAIQSRLDGLKEAADQIAEGIPGNVLDRLNRAKEAVAEEQAAADTPPTSEQQAEIDELQSWADDLQSQVDSFKRKIQQAEIQNGETVDSLTADLEAANQQAIEAKEELEAFKESLQTPAEEQQ